MTGILEARTLMREALRLSLAGVRVLGRSHSWFIMERGKQGNKRGKAMAWLI
jgi:hypothetical protein